MIAPSEASKPIESSRKIKIHKDHCNIKIYIPQSNAIVLNIYYRNKISCPEFKIFSCLKKLRCFKTLFLHNNKNSFIMKM